MKHLSGHSVDEYINATVTALETTVDENELITALTTFDSGLLNDRLLQALELIGQVRPIRQQTHVDKINAAVALLKA